MSEQNKAAVRRFWEGFNNRNLDVWDEVCAPNFVNHDPGLPNPNADLQTIKQLINEQLEAFSLNSSEEDMIAEGDKVVVRRIFRGTHDGEFMGIAPTGNKLTYTGTFITRLHGGNLEEQWVNFDILSLLQQIGAISMPE